MTFTLLPAVDVAGGDHRLQCGGACPGATLMMIWLAMSDGIGDTSTR